MAKEGRRLRHVGSGDLRLKRGGTKGLAEMVATDLREEGLQVDLVPPNKVKRLDEHEAVVVGRALYAVFVLVSRGGVTEHLNQLFFFFFFG